MNIEVHKTYHPNGKLATESSYDEINNIYTLKCYDENGDFFSKFVNTKISTGSLLQTYDVNGNLVLHGERIVPSQLNNLR
uniref:Uncharacterized protein n=1 Tax=viral metagenome TaxID=1070528 RepID=A0A6C0ECR4_9ZZZZ